ncbi:sporulation protein [Spirillospora sp. NPDC050679]
MVFKKMMGALGMGGPKVDTVLATGRCSPGGTLDGEVRLTAADYDADVQHLTLALVAGVEAEHGQGESTGAVEFHRARVGGPFRLAARTDRVVPFRLPVPWETPLTEAHGVPLHGMAIGVRTELAVAKAVDKGDLDPVAVAPLPSQEHVLTGFERAGFVFKGADLEYGQLYGVPQHLPFHQEIEFYPPPAYTGRIEEVELTFVAEPGGLAVVLEADRRTGLFGSTDQVFRLQVGHGDAQAVDWAAELTAWLDALTGGPAAPAHAYDKTYGQAYDHSHGHSHGHPYGHGLHHDDSHGHHEGHGQRRGPGWAGVAAGAAAGVAVGVAGGMVADEVIDEFFDDEDDED